MNGERLKEYILRRVVGEYISHQELNADAFIRECTFQIVPAYIRKKFHRERTVPRGRPPRWAVVKEHENELVDCLHDVLRDFVPEHYPGVLRRKVVYPFNKALCLYLDEPERQEGV